MSRLRILVEGESEEDFVNEVLAPHLLKFKVEATALHLGVRKTSRGIVSWQSASKHITNSLLEDGGLFVSTFVDYYKLKKDWPGIEPARSVRFNEKVSIFQRHLGKAIFDKMGDKKRPDRFIPFVMVHEFETLLFANPQATAKGLGMVDLEAPLLRVRDQFSSPEEINHSEATAPSKRLVSIFKELKLGHYDKRLHGNIAILEIGLEELRNECQQFGAWLTCLEKLGGLS